MSSSKDGVTLKKILNCSELGTDSNWLRRPLKGRLKDGRKMRFVWNFRGSCPVLDQSASINVDFHWTRATNSSVFHQWFVAVFSFVRDMLQALSGSLWLRHYKTYRRYFRMSVTVYPINTVLTQIIVQKDCHAQTNNT